MPTIIGSIVKSFSNDNTDKASDVNVEISLSNPSLSGDELEVDIIVDAIETFESVDNAYQEEQQQQQLQQEGGETTTNVAVAATAQVASAVEEQQLEAGGTNQTVAVEDGTVNKREDKEQQQEVVGEEEVDKKQGVVDGEASTEDKNQGGGGGEEEEKKDDGDPSESNVKQQHPPPPQQQQTEQQQRQEERQAAEEEKLELHHRKQLEEEDRAVSTLSDNVEDPLNTSATMIEITNLAMAVAKADEEESKSSSKKGRRRRNKDGHSSTTGKDDDDESIASSVSFGSVQVREYERVIDSSNIYMGLSLGWDYNQIPATPIREKNKTAKYATTPTNSPGTNGLEQVDKGDGRLVKRTNGSDRYGMMMRYGYTRKDLKKATAEAAKFYKQRQKMEAREAARRLVVADERENQRNKEVGENKKSPTAASSPRRTGMFRSMFHR